MNGLSITSMIVDELVSKTTGKIELLLGPGWYTTNGVPIGQLELWRDSRGRIRTDGRVRYAQGKGAVTVRVKYAYNDTGFERTAWACHDTPINRDDIPMNRQKRETLVRNIVAMRTLSFGDSKPRSKNASY